MDVYVIPVGHDRYELYCEQPAETDEAPASAPSGLIGRLRHTFESMVRSAQERQRRGAAVEHQAKGWMGRMQDHAMAWVVERIAEQRLLWNLRTQETAVAAHPQDMTFAQVQTFIRQTLQRDYDRHRRWLVIDGIAFVVTFVALGPLFLIIPGVANLPALYFGFRAGGHFLSMRGAAHGLHRVQWTGRVCPPLTELRDVAVLEAPARSQRVRDIAARLRLPHLISFFERVAIHHV
jgi:hypothetical protein